MSVIIPITAVRTFGYRLANDSLLPQLINSSSPTILDISWRTSARGLSIASALARANCPELNLIPVPGKSSSCLVETFI